MCNSTVPMWTEFFVRQVHFVEVELLKINIFLRNGSVDLCDGTSCGISQPVLWQRRMKAYEDSSGSWITERAQCKQFCVCMWSHYKEYPMANEH